MPIEDTKIQNTLWWVASIAVSVLCCSALFILFAGYLVDVKAEVKNTNFRIDTIEARENSILANLDAIRKQQGAEVTAKPSPDVPTAANAPTADNGQTAQQPSPTVTVPVQAAPGNSAMPEKAPVDGPDKK